MPTELEERAREFLDAEIKGSPRWGMVERAEALRAITAALQAQHPISEGAYTLSQKVFDDLTRQSCPAAWMQLACDSIARHLPAQQPGAQAAAWLITWDKESAYWGKRAVSFDKCHPDDGTCAPLYTHQQPPSIPEPSVDDAKSAIFARNAVLGGGDAVRGMLAALTDYTARLRERIGGVA